jgi:hypothetical protein
MWPTDTQHLSIVGKTGTGKTQAAAWHLSRRSFDVMPWIIINHKRDDLLTSIRAEEIDLDKVPRKAGLYSLHPLP